MKIHHLFSLTVLLATFFLLLFSNLTQARQSQSAHNLTFQALRLNQELEKAPPHAKAKAQNRLIQTLQQRSQVLQSLMVQDPRQAFTLILPPHLLTSFPQTLQPHLEDPVTLEGELITYILDVPTQDHSEAHFYLKTDQSRHYRVSFAKPSDSPLPSTKRVRLKGYLLESNLLLESDEEAFVTILEENPDLPAQLTKKVAVFLFNFQDDPREPYTTSYARGVYFTNTNSVNRYYQEASYAQWDLQGKVRQDGDVYGWFTIPYSYTGSCDYVDWANNVLTQASSQDIDTSGYDNRAFVFPRATQCNWSGLATLGGSSSWIAGNTAISPGTVAHELGHNYRLHHASTYNCSVNGQRVTLSHTTSNCTQSEYGDPFDAMGNAIAYKHFDAKKKGQTGGTAPTWLAASNIETVSTSGTYSLVPIETLSSGIQSLRILRSVNPLGTLGRYYYLEFRQPSVFDNFATSAPVVNGISLRLSGEFSSTDRSLLLDTTPSTTTYTDAPLSLGQTFSDPENNLNITTVSVSPQEAQVQVTFGPLPCTHLAPAITISPASHWSYPGQTQTYTLTLTNQDSSGCDPATLLLSSSVPSGFTQVPETLSFTLNPGTGTMVDINLTPHTTAPEESYSFTETLHHTDSNLATSVTGTLHVMLPDETPPQVTIISPQDGSALTKPKVDISATSSDASGISRLEIFFDGKSEVVCTNSTTCNTSKVITQLASGVYLITATATDASPSRHTSTTNITVYHNVPTPQPTSTTPPNPDANGDAFIDILDILHVITNFFSAATLTDINQDGQTNIFDLNYIIRTI